MKKTLLIIATILGIGTAPIVAGSNLAYASGGGASQQIISAVDEVGGSSNKGDFKGTIKTIIQTMFFILGVLAVIMIIYAGIQYVISAGDSGKVTKAKNTIIYSVVGLVVAIMAYAIVGFVVDILK